MLTSQIQVYECEYRYNTPIDKKKKEKSSVKKKKQITLDKQVSYC